MIPNKPSLRLCMGSSCHCRGNSEIAEVLVAHLGASGLRDKVDLVGSLCEGKCTQGPNITIAGETFGSLETATVIDLVERKLLSVVRKA